MSAPTVWEEGRWSGRRVTRFSVFACVVPLGAERLASPGLGLVFDSGFVLLCIAMALAVRPQDFFGVGVLPPLLLLGLCAALGLVDRAEIAPRGDGFVQAVISGLAHHSGPLLAGYALTLAVLAIRNRVIARYPNRSASPAPTRVTSAAPEVKSTTVVGNEPDSPSMTASRT